MRGHISDTAYLVNESRARSASLSGDVLARYWIPAGQRQSVALLWDDFAREVYPYDDLELAIRNRFFLQRMQDFVTGSESGLVCNVGAGFTSYPFLLDRAVQFMEIDYGYVIAEKREQLARLQQDGRAPARTVEFFAADLNDPRDRQGLSEKLAEATCHRPSFILLEGVSYYLSREVLSALFGLFSSVQRPGSVLAFDFWRPDLAHHPVFLRLQKFFVDRFGHHQRDYFLFDEEFIGSVEGYEARIVTDVAREAIRFAGTAVLGDRRKILLENYAILVKAGAPQVTATERPAAQNRGSAW